MNNQNDSVLSADNEMNEEYFICNSRIKELRIENGLTQTDLARILGTSQREYWRLEQGGYKIPPSKFFQLAIFYNVSLDYIFGIIDEKKKITDKPTSCNDFVLEDVKKAKASGMDFMPSGQHHNQLELEKLTSEEYASLLPVGKAQYDLIQDIIEDISEDNKAFEKEIDVKNLKLD